MGRGDLAVVGMSALRIGAVFPGQGSQTLGMGVDVAQRYPAAAEIFASAEKILGYDLLALQREGPEERLRETQYSQPAIFVTNLALATAVRGLAPQIVATAGHSFAEFCSLVIAGAISFENALRIVDERGKAMNAAAATAPGGMSAILGLDAAAVRAVTDATQKQTGLRVSPANFNAPAQIVISGDLEGVLAAGEAALVAGAKRVVPLNVSGAWHSALMEPAVARFQHAVDAASFRMPDRVDVISNVDAQPYRSTDEMRKNLVASIVHEVRWHETAIRLLECKLDLVVEFGASAVLAPMMKRMPNAPEVIAVSDAGGVERLEARLLSEVEA